MNYSGAVPGNPSLLGKLIFLHNRKLTLHLREPKQMKIKAREPPI